MKNKILSLSNRVTNYVKQRPILLAFLTTIVIVVIGFIFLSQQFPQETALKYSQEIFPSLEEQYCPSENLTAKIEGTLASERTVNVIATTIRDSDGLGYVHEGVGRVVAQSPVVEEGTVFAFILHYPLPDDIPPGTYRYTQNLLQNGGRPIEGFDVFFNIGYCQ